MRILPTQCTSYRVRHDPRGPERHVTETEIQHVATDERQTVGDEHDFLPGRDRR